MNNSMAQPKPVTVGVPTREYPWTPTFPSSLPECLNHRKSIIYADDTLLYYYTNNISELELNVNSNPYPII